jgi:LuxR family maltose regulon positive regulatory protein
LEPLVPIAEWRRRPGILIEIHILQALAHRAQGSVHRAMDAFRCALSLAEPEGYVRIFADEGEPVAELLREGVMRGIAASYGRRLLAALGMEVKQSGEAESAGPPSVLVEPLTVREVDVLRLLGTHLTSTEIAEQLYVSPNTVRFHIKNIYGKLGVHRRSDAVERARELRLI